jgi:uncharacterized protein (DUF2141 family)
MSRTLIAAMIAAVIMPAGAADLTITVEGVASADGQLMIALYDSAANFPAKSLRAMAVPAAAGTVQVQVRDLAAGDYAFAVYHDANGNGKLDRNTVGIPTEDYGFSNNALGKRGAPAFEDARVALPAAGAATSISLR